MWGALKQWETVLGTALVLWAKGRHARLTPFAQRLLWAELVLTGPTARGGKR